MVDKRIQQPTPAERDEAALAPFFAAARTRDPGPTTTLLSAILADASAVAAARQAPVPVAVARYRGRFQLVGGWRGLAALAACAALGFWIGIAGEVPIDSGQTSWATYDTSSDGSDTGTDDQLGAFFDLASVEG